MSIEDYILAFLKTAEEEKVIVTPIRLQKTFFLLEKEKGIDLKLNFEPFFFGPYSEKLTNIMYELGKQGLIVIKHKEVINPLDKFFWGYAETYELGKNVEIIVSEDILSFFRDWIKKDKNEILKYIEEKYPEYFGIGPIQSR